MALEWLRAPAHGERYGGSCAPDPYSRGAAEQVTIRAVKGPSQSEIGVAWRLLAPSRREPAALTSCTPYTPLAVRMLAIAASVASAGILAASVASANTVVLCGWLGCEAFVLGPSTPEPRSSPHMRFHIKPHALTAGATFHATAKGFLPHEYVTIWDYYGKRYKHSSELNGGDANAHGKLTFIRETFAHITKTGTHKVCLQGERSKRVACATYKVRSAGPAEEPGFKPPTEGPGAEPQSEGEAKGRSEEGGYTPPSEGPGYVPPAEG